MNVERDVPQGRDKPAPEQIAAAYYAAAAEGIAVSLISYGEVFQGAYYSRDAATDLDLLIAATALAHDRILLTGNVRDFQHVPGLQIADFREM